MVERILLFWAFGAVALVVTDVVAAQSANKIYRCVVNEQIVFTDRACAHGQAGAEVELAPTNIASAPLGAANLGKDADRKSDRQVERQAELRAKEAKSIAIEQARAKQRCERLAEQMAAIQSKFRQGYSIEEGNRLRERQRKLEDERRAERCRH